ncbi:MAG: 50S ribosomal protein L18 [Bacteriovoracaceae bacterium]|jgi:large subunit ribosomal protein L18|nr:50S ribosomal protein L18 [Bacteriovoracaceae bacterium]
MRKSLKKIKNESKAKEYRRKLSIRKKIIGTTEKPRICATKTNKHLFVQVIDDSTSKTLFSVQTFGKNAVGTKANADSAKEIGVAVAKGLAGNNINTAVFDRNGKKYTGIISTLADSIRENGIQI